MPNFLFKYSRGLLIDDSPTYLPQPNPVVNLIFLKSYVDAIYSRVNCPVPAKSSRPMANVGRLFAFGLYENFTLFVVDLMNNLKEYL